MPWPLPQDYNEAIQSPAVCFADEELREGRPSLNRLGLPIPRSGNFADVYEFSCPANKWAIKCFTREIAGLKERYREVSAYLKQTNLPFMVDFTYLEQGIRVRGQWFPILKMRWVEGFTLNEFVRNNLEKPQLLDVLSQLWVKLAAKLLEAQMAHCDLQHGNVLLVPGSKAASLAVKLVDYDGMWVPALARRPSGEVGLPAYQHPQRLREGTYNLKVDRFSHLVIYTALRALVVGGKALWDKYDNGDNLLFRQADFEAPARSVLIAELLRLNDPVVRRLTENVVDACKRPLDQTPLLHELLPTPQSTESPAQPNVAPASTARKAPVWFGLAAVMALAALIGGLFLMFGDKQDKETPKVAEKRGVAQVSEQKGSPLKAETDQEDWESLVDSWRKSYVVIKADYGTEQKRIDVTQKVKDSLASGEFPIVSAGNHLAGDPAPNEKKWLNFDYQFGHGKVQSVRLSEGDTFIDPRLVKGIRIRGASKELEVRTARYGSGTRWGNVTDKAKTIIRDPYTSFRAHHDSFAISDPAPFEPKFLIVCFDFDGSRYLRVIPEGSTASLLRK
jgi:hypothetical protein